LLSSRQTFTNQSQEETKTMRSKRALLGVAVGVVLLSYGCATKGFVQSESKGLEARVNQKIGAQQEALAGAEVRLKETSAGVEANRGRIDAVDAKVAEVGGKVGEAATLAREAKAGADKALTSVQDLEVKVGRQIANRNKYTLVETKTVYFDFGKSQLNDGAITGLLEVAKILKEDPNAIVEMEGYTDALGGDDYNFRLSQERVNAVVRNLAQKHGIELRRFFAVGHGKTAPVAENASKAGREKNRRVTLKILTT
jgi:outer membrane protein OmpA-like peptidoglycan-associated protein